MSGYKSLKFKELCALRVSQNNFTNKALLNYLIFDILNCVGDIVIKCLKLTVQNYSGIVAINCILLR